MATNNKWVDATCPAILPPNAGVVAPVGHLPGKIGPK